MTDPLREQLLAKIGAPMGASGAAVAPDPVNVAMIRHWVDALDDRNPAYDEATAATTRFEGLVAPPAMLQTWTMGRPIIAGIAARGGAANEIGAESPLTILADAGFTATLATNSVVTFDRYLRVGDVITSTTALEAVSECKHTGIGRGYFVTWTNSYQDAQGQPVGAQHFTVYRFQPGPPPDQPRTGDRSRAALEEPAGEELSAWDLDVTATVVVAGALASRDFMPVHHDRDYAIAQGAPDIFMNILTSKGYVARYVTDWSGPDALLREISVRLGAPAVPGKALRFRGQVASDEFDGDERRLVVNVRADSDLGNHLSGTVTLTR